MITSNVCRVHSAELEAFLADKGSGMHVIPETVLAPRQVRLVDLRNIIEIPAVLKPHRGSMIPVISRDAATTLVSRKVAQWEPQKALVYDINAYIRDPDVANNAEELARAMAAKDSGETLVLVAIIGESRSALAVCRNIVSGCQKPDKLKDDAEGAVSAANVYLVE